MILPLLFGAALGFIVAYYMFDRDDAIIDCPKGEMLIEFCVDTTGVNYGGVPVSDTELQALFTKSFNSGSPIGFSLGKQLIGDLAEELSTNPDTYGGFHLYPGLDSEGTKYLIKIPLNLEGMELPDVGSKIELSSASLLGPCPRWCGDSRIVIRDPSSPSESPQ